MSTFQSLEKEYLNITPFDTDQLLPFYEMNKSFFISFQPVHPNELKRYLSMLSEIGQTYSFSGKHKTAIAILNRVINLYETNHNQMDIDLTQEVSYNQACWSKGYSLMEQKQFAKAKPIFKHLQDLEAPQNADMYEIILKICNWKIKNRIAVGLGVTGFLILSVKYSVKWIYPENYSEFFVYFGFLGSILIISSGLMYKFKIDSKIIDKYISNDQVRV
ncbi:hypothetical protein KFE98_15340 [bacterium SCSIO 12741]|nr:hypothetical protein KFE98_15340 [bacterium SCSIO 12741]